MTRFKYCIYIILFITVFSICAYGNNKAVGTSPVIQVNDNLLTVKVRDMPLKAVLKEVVKQKPIKISFLVSAEELIVSDFSELPMEKGLKKLLRDYNYVFSYGAEKSKDGEREIRKVVILSNGEKSQHRREEPIIAYTEEPYDEDMDYQENEDMYVEDSNFQDEHMADLLEESDPMIVTTGGTAFEPLGDDAHDEETELDLLREAFQNDDAEIRLNVVEELGLIGSSRAIEALEGALTDEDEAVRELAAQELGQLKGGAHDEEMEFDLLREEFQDEDAVIRLMVVEELGQRGGSRAIQALEGALSDEDETVREIAAKELSRLKGEGIN